MMSGRVMWLVSVLAVLTALGVSALVSAQDGPPGTRVRLDAVRREAVEPYRRVTGELAPTRRSRVAAERDGLVVEMLIEAGDVVTEGQVIARLDRQPAELELKQSEATLAAAQAMESVRRAAQLRARRDVDRTRVMQQGDAAFGSELEDRETDLAGAEAWMAHAMGELHAAEARVADAQRRLSDIEIIAPYGGQVVAKLTEIGQWVREGDAVVEIIERSPIDAWLDVPEQYLPAIRAASGSAGGASEVEIVASSIGVSARGTVQAVIAQGESLGRTFPVRVRLANEDGALLPGMSIVGVVPTGGSAEVITVHKDAVLRNDAGSFLYFDAGGVAAIAPVEIEFAVGDRLAVRSPMLREGMMAIVEGNERLFPGAPLAPMNAAPPTGGPSASGAEGH